MFNSFKGVDNMPNITPRTNKNGEISYLIRVYIDENSEGKQKVKSMTWKAPKGMAEKKVQKELQKAAAVFEEQVRKGLVAFDGNITFADYATEWLKYANIAERTRERYIDLLVRINQGIGHIRLSKLESRHIKEFEEQLRRAGAKKGGYAVDKSFTTLISELQISKAEAARRSGVGAATISAVCCGKHFSIDTANKIATAFKHEPSELFDIHELLEGLADKTILHHHRLITLILGNAKKERLIPFNVASEHMDTPKVRRKEANYLDDEQARELVDLLFDETDLRIRTAIMISLYTGVRRGELCGLE